MAPLYTVEDVMALLGIGKSTLYALKRKDSWPHVLVGSKVRFTDEHIAQIVQLYTKTPAPQQQRRPRIGTRAKDKK